MGAGKRAGGLADYSSRLLDCDNRDSFLSFKKLCCIHVDLVGTEDVGADAQFNNEGVVYI